MVSRQKHQANIGNAKLSTGPRTIRGKQKARMNAVRHGLNMRFGHDVNDAAEIQELATIFAEGNDSPEVKGYARLLAEACFDLQRIECVKALVLDKALNDPEPRVMTLKEFRSLTYNAVVGMRRLSRIRVALARVQAGRGTKADFAHVASAWPKYFVLKMEALLQQIEGDPFELFEQAAKEITKEITKLNQYHQRALAKRRKILRGQKAPC